MKKPLFLLLVIVCAGGIISCSKKEEDSQKWEYKTMMIAGIPIGDFHPRLTTDEKEETAQLDSLGKEGWELVDVYTSIETVHPNFGNDKYVTGLQSNTRTQAVHYIFKRPKQVPKM